MQSVCMVTMATGRYAGFVPALVDSARRHVQGLGGVCLLSEAPVTVPGSEMTWLPWGHFAWPYPTLLRYRAMSAYSRTLLAYDVVFFIDVDMLFVGSVDLTAVSGHFAVAHPGYVDVEPDDLPYERRSESAAFVPVGEGTQYFCGGVQGGSSEAYVAAVSAMADRVDADLAHDLVPVWHDESVWNRWCLDNPPCQVFSSDYCTPEGARSPRSRIVALRKGHDHFREIPLGQRLAKQARRLERRLR